MLSHSRNVSISGGTFTSVEMINGSTAFEKLQGASAPSAFHNSGERHNPPRCHENTRVALLDRLLDWIMGRKDQNTRIMWIHGAPGSGKSAIAQTIAERCHARKLLLASFFFSRWDLNRNHALSFFPTLAYQLACAIPQVRTNLDSIIERDPLIFTRSLEAQALTLIVEPLESLTSSAIFNDSENSPRLIVLDGLDECQDSAIQDALLDLIARFLRQYNLPLIFLIASRSEQALADKFHSPNVAEFCSRIHLADEVSLDDIYIGFLRIHSMKSRASAGESTPSSSPLSSPHRTSFLS